MLDDDKIRLLCNGDESMYKALHALGLLLDPSRTMQKAEEFIAQSRSEEKGSSRQVEGARPIYRIIMRIALARGFPYMLREYAEKEDRFFQGKLYWPFVDKAEKAIEIIRRFYLTSPS